MGQTYPLAARALLIVFGVTVGLRAPEEVALVQLIPQVIILHPDSPQLFRRVRRIRQILVALRWLALLNTWEWQALLELGGQAFRGFSTLLGVFLLLVELERWNMFYFAAATHF